MKFRSRLTKMSSIITVIASILNIPIEKLATNLPANSELRQLLPDFTRQVENCYTSQGFTDQQLGTFTAQYSYSCVMPSKCPPEKPENFRPKFLLHLRQYPSKVFDIDHTDTWVASKLKGKLTFFVPGFFTDYLGDKRGNQTAHGFLNNHQMNTDFVLIDYFHGSVYREQAVANTRVLGALIGQLVSDLGIVSRTICVGFSLGAHTCGFAGQWLQKHRNVFLPSCIGIDPSGPSYQGCASDQKLSIGDCEVISILHGSYYPSQGAVYGSREKSGNCDFYVNLRRREPECPTSDPGDFIKALQDISFNDFVSGVKQIMACDHLRTYELFNRLLLNEIRIPAKICGSNDPSNNRNTKFLPPFNTCKRNDDFNYCLDIDRLP